MDFWNSLPWEQIDRVGILLGIVAFFPLMWAVWLYWRRNTRLRKNINNAIARANTHQPVYIELTGQNVVVEVAEKYLNKQKLVGQILPYVMLERKGINLNDFNEIEKLKGEIVDLKIRALEKAPECIHLFYAGPVAVAIMIGDIFSNCKNVHIYHKDNDSGIQLVAKI